ncbi:hypothetical protein CRYUN_Cryun27aG0080100 [Craigia yunnanensis]
MDRTSADMMETEASAAAAASPHQQGQNDFRKELLTMARYLIDQGKPSQALQAASEDCIDGTSIGDTYLASELAIVDQTKILLLCSLGITLLNWGNSDRKDIKVHLTLDMHPGPLISPSNLCLSAMEQVVMAVRTSGGDEAVFQSLYRAREVYRTRMLENTTVDQLASLFAECAIAEAEPSKAE